MDDVLRQNPDLMNQFNAAAMDSVSKTNPGFGGFMNNMMNSTPQPPAHQTMNNGATNQHINMGPPPPPLQTKNVPPPRRPGMMSTMSSNRPDLQAAKDDAIELNDNFVDINNEKSMRPLTSETKSRPEMRGPSDISDLLNGLKSKSPSLGNTSKVDPFKNDRKSPATTVETKNIKDVNIPSFDAPITIEKDETGSTISLTELKELESEGTVPRKNRKKQRSSRNTISLDI
jgi:hypothetical protein